METLSNKLKTIKDSFSNLSFDETEKETVERKLSESLLEEEELENVFTEKLKVGQKIIEPGVAIQDDQKCTFSKLPNPIQIHLRNFQVCDGLDVNKLLGFIKNILKLKEETELTDEQIVDLSLGYTTGPLHIKILECKRLKLNLNVLHSKLLSYFVPVGLRESLKRNLVNRPQRVNEALNCYILSVKENAILLNSTYSEQELVELITIGMNPETRPS